MYCLTSKFLKYLTFALNVIIACGSVVLVGFGIAYIVKEHNGAKIFGDSFSFGALTISVGGIALAACIFGCFALFLENRILLTIHASLLFLVFIIQLALGTMAVTKINNEFRERVQNLIQNLYDENNYDTIQTEFSCCGISGPDYFNVTTGNYYPVSCCPDLVNCRQPFELGCTDAFLSLVGGYVETIGTVGITFAVFEVFGAFLAFVARKRGTLFV